MSEDFFDTNLSEPKEKPKYSQHLTWQEVWSTAVMNPSVESFELILSDPAARPQRAYTWVFLTVTFSAIVNMIFMLSNIDSLIPASSLMPSGYSFGPVIVPTMICMAVFAGPFAILALIIGAGILQFIARLLGGVGTFREFVYVYGAILAPIALVSTAFNILPLSLSGITQLLGFALSIYQFVLVGKALKAVNQYSTGAAIKTLLAPIAIIIVLSIFLFSCGLTMSAMAY